MRRSEGRSAALARAEAHLAGRRLTAREQSGAAALVSTSPTSSHGLSAIHMATDLSSLSGSSSACPRGRRKELESTSLAKTSPPPSPGPNSRFLKQKPQKVATDTRQVGLSPAAGMCCGSAAASSKGGRSGAILRKLEQIESKIRSRQAGRDVGQAPTSDDELSLGDFSPEQRLGALRGLEKAARLKENLSPVWETIKAQARDVPLKGKAGCDGEEGAERHRHSTPKKSGGQEDLPALILCRKSRIQSPQKSPSPSSSRSSLPGKTFLKKPLRRSPSPPSRNAPPRPGTVPSHSASPSAKGRLAGCASTNAREASLSERSIVQSLDELFLATDDMPSTSSSDFRVNVLSLDDLAPSVASQNKELKQEAVMRALTESGKEPGEGLFAAVIQSPFKAPIPTAGDSASLEGPGETEISERLESTSARSSLRETTVGAEYSEDFEPLPSSAASEEWKGGSSLRESCSPLEASTQSGQPGSSFSLSCPLESTRSTRLPRRIVVKDAAVQTSRSSLAYSWLESDVPAALGQMVGGGGGPVEAPPITSHVVSLETMEALTTYSPAVFALNDMLKQNVVLIRRFVEATRHLHASFVASLEEEMFHYHTLEEAKEYIAWHRPPPLTVEQVLQELEDWGQVAF
ncbi:uncharacterized protein C19orf44 homolog isoform X1 [Rhineura floridana]|uniref:uncharacterized protein C19orf44 homolog isoform X1 n=1 Tax=Rhineura floridana TaxID=261503 RepID=UPI002AC7E80B|nr:uncharacterized protein C19orf44 homolog isoform X1 [Rhineura floridana]